MKPIDKNSVSFECCELCHADYGTMLDYCAVCGKNLCHQHMEAGHCGNVPALSGNAETEKWMNENSERMYQDAKRKAVQS